jgi:hypothetical protein
MKKKTPSQIVSKEEALELISDQLRRPEIEDASMVKLMTLYSKLSGWENVEPSQPEETVDMKKLIAAVEKRRKSQ